MDIPSLFMIPSAVSSGKVHSVFPNSTDADFDFNRDSDATRVNSEGLIERVGYYGSELILNGDFATDSNWVKGAGWTISGGEANCNSGSSTELYQSLAVSGKTYKITFTITSYTSGQIAARAGGITGVVRTSIGTFTDTITANGTQLGVFNSGGFVGSIDNVSAVEVTGDRARLNYEIEGGLVNTKPSLLLEPQSTNLITYSNNVIDSGNVYSNMSGLINQVTSPEGVINAGALIENTANTDHYFQRGLAAISSSNYYTVSFFAKYNGRGASVNIGASRLYAHFDLQAGTVIASGNNSDWQNLSTDIINYGNGWYKCVLTGQSVTGVAGYIRVHTNNGITSSYTSSYTGDGKSGIFIYGIQFEQQAYCTSYIPTNGSTQTRAAETCNGAGTSSIFESSEGILYCEIAALADDGNIKHISLSDGSTNNRIIIAIDEYNDVRFYYQGTGGSVLVSFSNQSLLFSKIAIRYKSGNFCYYINGAKVGVNTSAISFSGLNDLSFNNPYQGGTSPLYGKIRDIRVYNTKEMTDSEVDILLTKITS